MVTQNIIPWWEVAIPLGCLNVDGWQMRVAKNGSNSIRQVTMLLGNTNLTVCKQSCCVPLQLISQRWKLYIFVLTNRALAKLIWFDKWTNTVCNN